MARNQGRLISPWRQTSSLFRASRTAQNIQDREMDFKWDFNMISNQDYLTYVQNRRNQQTATDDIMKWERTLRTVQREVRSDQRADAFLRISQMPDNTTAKAQARVNAYRQLAESALADGDQDAYIAAVTAHNNAITSLQNAMDAEGRRGAAASKRAFRNEMRAVLNEIQDREQTLRENRRNMTPGQIAAELTTINEAKAIYHQGFAEGLNQLDPDDPAIIDRLQDARRFGARANEEAAIIDWETDADGNRTVPRTEVDHLGQVTIKPAEGIIRRFDRGVETWEDSRTGQRLTYEVGDDGTMSLTETPSVIANDDWFTDRATGRQFRIQTPVNITEQHRLNQPRERKTADDRYFEVPTVVGDQVRNIQYLLNEGRPIARRAADQALLDEQYRQTTQRVWAERAGLGETPDPRRIPQFDYELGTWRVPEGDKRPLRIPENMGRIMHGMSTPEERADLEGTMGIQRPGMTMSTARALTPSFNQMFFTGNRPLSDTAKTSLARKSEEVARNQQRVLSEQAAIDRARDAFVASAPAILQPVARPLANVTANILRAPAVRPHIPTINRAATQIMQSPVIRNIKMTPPVAMMRGAANIGQRAFNFVRNLFRR